MRLNCFATSTPWNTMTASFVWTGLLTLPDRGLQPVRATATSPPVSTIVVHGGAGRETSEDRAARDAGIARALEAGWAVLTAGGDALDAAVASVVVLEDDPHFNAG